MFLGQFRHSIDEKGRLTIPSRFREVLVAEGAFVLQGFDQNLMVLTPSTFERMSQRIHSMNMTDPTARLLRRLFFSTASQVEVDKAGRILIQQYLREAVQLDSEVVVVGVGDFFEIWGSAQWAAQISQLQDIDANAQRFAALDLTSA